LESVSGGRWVVAGSLSFVEVFAYDVFVDPACEKGGGFGCNLSMYGLFECVSECGGTFFDNVDLWEFPNGT
jgi:hypothetical protein